MHLANATVEWNKEAGPSLRRIGLGLGAVAGSAQPGQFVMLRVSSGPDPLLRRPFSIFRVHDDEVFEILFQVKGRGTAALARSRKGDELSVFGPLGNGFSIEASAKLHLLVGGGVGAAPMVFLASHGASQGLFTRENCLVVLGARNSDLIIGRDDVAGLPVRLAITTDDGSQGRQGTVMAPLEEALETSAGPACLYACGPSPMLRALASFADRPGLTAWASVEERMACGIGACRACVVKVGDTLSTACLEGPVFDLTSLHFEAP